MCHHAISCACAVVKHASTTLPNGQSSMNSSCENKQYNNVLCAMCETAISFERWLFLLS
jgi:hypothetical protein